MKDEPIINHIQQPLTPTKEDYLNWFTLLFSDRERFNILHELYQPFLHFIPGNTYETIIQWFLDFSGMTFEELIEPYCQTIYEGYQVIEWKDLHPGAAVYVDNFQHGKYPFAAPRISGPYLVLKPEEHLLQTTWKCGLPSEMKRGGGTFRPMTPRPDEPILIKTPVPEARLAEYWRWLTDQEIKRGRVVGPFDFFGSNVSLERVFHYIEVNWQVKIDRKAFPELVLISNK